MVSQNRAKTRVLSSRISQTKILELKQLYPKGMSESEIINDLVKEKLARAQFEKWMADLQAQFDVNDFDLESIDR